MYIFCVCVSQWIDNLNTESEGREVESVEGVHLGLNEEVLHFTSAYLLYTNHMTLPLALTHALKTPPHAYWHAEY